MTTNQYTLVHKKHNSAVYGNCEVCGKPASDLYHQMERKRYTRSDGSEGWTHSGCSDKFGHLECLKSIRKPEKDQAHQNAA